MKELERIEELLIETTPPNMIVELEALRQPLLRLRTDKYVELTNAREKCRHPKDKDLTDWDRRVMNDAMVATLQAEYDYLAGLEELVKERINFTWQ
jgi:hypothetical protein